MTTIRLLADDLTGALDTMAEFAAAASALLRTGAGERRSAAGLGAGRGGRPHRAWDGVTVVSKSGAFGPPSLLRDLLARNGFFPERIN